ncbi:hypothetical protein FA95DRAFT_1201509 [Auriscalpium vulgare]|uniref:Uncharacterized protein n=1 Tax=Auriscalpium vulgare TaxID=40419 RepID=A0ACB8R3H0_9AGAM|nr:hypothetical protein FA95DRAFT_1201509 [Auriscalpium vulgare]
MTKIPLNIQVIVLEWVYRSSQHNAIDYPTLLACAFVCGTWTHLAQRLLFRRVPFASINFSDPNDVARTALFLRTLRAAPKLATNVRVVTLYIQPLRGVGDNNTFEVLELCKNLNGIYVNGMSDIGFLAEPFLSRLEAIPMHPIFLSVAGDSAVVDHVINIRPSVRAESTCLCGPQASRSRRQSACPARCTRWRFTRGMCACSGQRRQPWHPHCAMSSFRMLTVTRLHAARRTAHGARRTALVVTGLLAQLRTLVVGPSTSVPPHSLLDTLASLETLMIAKLPKRACALPRGLRHHEYHVYGVCHIEQVSHCAATLRRRARSSQAATRHRDASLIAEGPGGV